VGRINLHVVDGAPISLLEPPPERPFLTLSGQLKEAAWEYISILARTSS
jgi:hypothetical protein